MKILCGTDLLPKSDSALERAAMLAGRLDAQLVLVHALPRAEPPHELENQLQRAGRELQLRATPPRWRHPVAPEFEVRTGSPAQVLVEASRDLDPALVVLGSNRRRFAADALAGTIAERILKQLDCPVLVVRRMPWRAYHRVLLILDFQGSSEVVDAAGRLVLPGGLRTPCISALTAGQTSHLALMDERAMMADVTHRELVRLRPDLLVVGAGRRGWLRRMIPGNIVSRALKVRGTDLLIVPRYARCAAPWRKSGVRGAWRWPELRELPAARAALASLTDEVCKAPIIDVVARERAGRRAVQRCWMKSRRGAAPPLTKPSCGPVYRNDHL